jgi:hypothetical protein
MMVMQHLFVVIRRYGPPYERGLPLEEQQDWEAHRVFMNALVAEGLVRLGGPLEEREDVLLIFQAENKTEIRTASRRRSLDKVRDPLDRANLALELADREGGVATPRCAERF